MLLVLLRNVASSTDRAAIGARGRSTDLNPRLIISFEDTAMKLTAPAGGCVMPIRPNSAMATAGDSACEEN